MATPRPKVRLLATGGSIAGIGPNRLDYMLYSELGDHLTIEESLARVPEVRDIAEIQAEDFISVGSTSIGPQEWLRMAQLINRIFREDASVDGVAITHGTATLEETAYFLHLTVKSSKPVVVTGAMRPPTALSTDADLNLLDAVRIAASPGAGGKGVLTVLNNEIQSARDVIKANTFRVETFRPNELGFPGVCRLRRRGGVLPDSDPQAHHIHPLRGGRNADPPEGGHRVRVCRLGRAAGGRRAPERVRRLGAGRVRRRHLSARRPAGGGQSG